jgi:predicted dehydrogenase
LADEFGAELASTDLPALATDPKVDLVYIATPHNDHFHTAKTLLQHGKPLLVEKPMTVNADQASQLIRLARSNGVFLMEAMWTRCLPIYQQVSHWISENKIGRVRLVESSFCIRGNQDPSQSWLNPALAGGGLLDLGVYNIAMSQFLLGQRPTQIAATASFCSTGVDELLSASLRFSQNSLAQFSCGFVTRGDNSLTIYGEMGRIHLPEPFFAAQEAQLIIGGQRETAVAPFRAEGFEFEIEEAVRCWRNGLPESPLMPLDDTLANLEVMDSIRATIGLRYPFE